LDPSFETKRITATCIYDGSCSFPLSIRPANPQARDRRVGHPGQDAYEGFSC
jgi:hypothetical protein